MDINLNSNNSAHGICMGGVTPGEIQEVAAAAAEVVATAAAGAGAGGGGKCEDIIIGGTGLLRDHDILRMIIEG